MNSIAIQRGLQENAGLHGISLIATRATRNSALSGHRRDGCTPRYFSGHGDAQVPILHFIL
jgi:hypothetical protein